jgi:hypothetical protein
MADPGPVESGVLSDLAQVGELPRSTSSLAQTAIVLARALDDGAGMGTASVARELRATMAALMEVTQDDTDGTAALESWVAGLQSEVGHQAN